MSDHSDVSYLSEEGDAFPADQQFGRPGGPPPAAVAGGRAGPPLRLSHSASLGSSAAGEDLMAATSWQEVDREQLSGTVLKLISSVASTAPTDDKSREAVIWHPAAVALNTQNLNDPLGFGKIDVVNLRLERGGTAGGAPGWQGGGLSPSREAMAAARQGKGVVGRFFSELARSDPQGSPAAAPYASSPLGAPSAAAAAGGWGGGGTGGGSSAAAAVLMARQGSLGAPLSREKLLPSEEGFDPETYLAIFHGDSSAPQLASGVRALERELGESTGQLKQLVKQNFERFISCKTTIDDIYTKLHRIESTQTGLSTEVLYKAIQEVQGGAADVFGPILERSAKAERIRSVQLLLKRFSGLFSAPQRVTALGAARDYEQVTAEWKKANGLIKPGPRTNQVWEGLYAEIEQRVAEVYDQQCREVQDPQLPADTATQLVGHMLALQAEGLPAAQGQDPLALLLAARERQFAAAMSSAASDHEQSVNRLKAAMAATAADERLQDPASITDAQLLRWQGSWDGTTNSSSSSRSIGHRQGLVNPADSPTAAAAAAAGGSGTALFSRALSGYRDAVPQAASDAAIAALEAVTGPTAATAAKAAAVAAAADSGGARRGFGGGGGLGGVLVGGVRGQHLAELAPLSGLQPPAPRSRILADTSCTAGEELFLRHIERLSSVLLECLPGFWQAAGPNKLTLPPNLPSSAAARLQATIDGAGDISKRLVDAYCQAVGTLTQAVAGVGPLREALLCAAEELASCISELEGQKAPSAALTAVRRVLGDAVSTGVQQLVGHLQAIAPVLVAREGWQLSLTHSGDQPVTLLPEQLQEEVTVAMQFYQQLLESATGHSSSSSTADAPAGSIAAAASKITTPDRSTKPIRDAYFSCLEDFIKQCMAATDHLRPLQAGGTAAAAAAGEADSGSPTTTSSRSVSKRRPGMSAAAAAAILGRESWEDTDVEAEGTFDVRGMTSSFPAPAATAAAAAAAVAAAGGGGGGGMGGAHVLRLVLSDDVKLLLIGSNLSFMREKLVGSLTQRFLLALTGENASELQRCSRYVVKLASRLDATIQAVHAIYTDRKRRAVDRLLAAYVQPDGSSVGVPPTLYDVSPQAQQLVQLVAAVQAETFTYARPFVPGILSAVLEHLGASLTTALTRLPVGVVGTTPAPQTSAAAAATAAAAAAGAGGAGGGVTGCPIEALGQYFMDLVYLEAALGKAGPASLSTDLSAAYHLLATRICPDSSSSSSSGLRGSSGRDRSAAETPLAKSLLAVRDTQELTSKLQVTCRKALGGVLERSAFTLRSLLPAPASKA